MTIGVSCDDVVIASRRAFGYRRLRSVSFRHPFHHLPRIVGRHRAFELLFSRRAFPAAEAHSLGIVSKVVESGEAMASARVLARSFAAKSPTVMRLGRAAFVRANDLDYRRSIESAVDGLCTIAGTDDAREELAFKENRKPILVGESMKWSGRWIRPRIGS